ncbi:hypothetical protein R3P38DRAFT_3287417 [Favolaschia claudopus]|uniref:Uncharacterized protein n=1 Tax=Favolaschia claudopus TaxID=2862362 RepID=A0AAW0A0Y5_9AGAR
MVMFGATSRHPPPPPTHIIMATLSSLMNPYPPLKSKFFQSPAPPPSPALSTLSTQFGLETCSNVAGSVEDEQRMRRNEKARLRMAEKRAEIKRGGSELQAAYAQRARSYSAKYRAKHHSKIRREETRRRYCRYREVHGERVFKAFLRARLATRELARIKHRDRNTYDLRHDDEDMDFSGDEEDFGSDDSLLRDFAVSIS